MAVYIFVLENKETKHLMSTNGRVLEGHTWTIECCPWKDHFLNCE